MSRNSSAFIRLPGGGHAFIDGLKQDRECNDRGDVIYRTASGKVIRWNTHRRWAHLTTVARRELIYAHYEKIDDRICMESSTCSICKESSISKAYWL